MGRYVARRLLLAKDGMGFSLHDTIIEAGTGRLAYLEVELRR